MKKTVIIVILFLLMILTGSKTLAYWPGGKLSFPPLFHAQTSGIKIGFWDFDKLPDLILDNPDLDWRNFNKDQVILLNDAIIMLRRIKTGILIFKTLGIIHLKYMVSSISSVFIIRKVRMSLKMGIYPEPIMKERAITRPK